MYPWIENFQTFEYLPMLISLLIGVASIAAVGVLVMAMLYALGVRALLYRGKEPIEGWNKQFYPAAAILFLILALIVTYLLGAYQHFYQIT